MTPLVTPGKNDQNIFWKILLICLNEIYSTLEMLSIKWRIHILTVFFLLFLTLLIVLFGLWGLIRGKGDILWLFQKDYRINLIISILLISPSIFIFLRAMDFFIKKKCKVSSVGRLPSSTLKSLLILQCVFFSVLLVVFLIPVFSGLAYNLEAIGTTFISLLYHVKSIGNGEIPFWFPESGLGYSLPLTHDLTRYLPSYILFFKPHHFFFGIFVVIHILFSAVYMRKLLRLLNADGLFTPMLIVSMFASGMLSKTLLANWLPSYYMALIWFPVLLYYTILFAQSDEYSQLQTGFTLGFFTLLAFYAVYMRMLVMIFLFLGLAFLLFYRHAKWKPLVVMIICLIFFCGALDKIYNVYLEVSGGRLPQVTAFAQGTDRLQMLNQFFKPFFIPTPKEIQTYISEYGFSGIMRYIFANLGLTPSVFKVFSPGFVLTFLFAIGVYYSFRGEKINEQKIALLGIGSILAGMLPVSFFRNLTGHWLTEPVLLVFLVIGAAIGSQHLIAHYRGNISRFATGLILLQVFLLSYTFLPMVVHLTTGRTILWYGTRQTFSGYGVPAYGFGSDYRHYGSGNHVDGLKKYSDNEYRVLFTKDFVKQTGATSKKLGRYIQTDHEWKEYQISGQLEKSIVENYILPDRFETRCNYHESFLTIQGVNSFNAYPKGKYMGDVANDYIWPGIYQLNPKDYILENTALMEILGIKTIFAVKGERINTAYQKQGTLLCDSDVIVEVLSNPNALQMAFLTDFEAGELENHYRTDCPPPPRYAPIGSDILNVRIEKGLWPPKILLCQDMSQYRKRVLTGKDGEIIRVKTVPNGLSIRMNPSESPKLLNVSQLYRAGWMAWDEHNNKLPVIKGHGGLLAILVEPGITEIIVKNRPIERVILFYLVFVTTGVFLLGGMICQIRYSSTKSIK